MNEENLKNITDLKKDYFLSGPVISKAETVFRDYFDLDKRQDCKLFFYKDNIYLLDEINMGIYKYETHSGLKKEIFKAEKDKDISGMSSCWSLGENMPKYLLVFLEGARKFSLLNLENDRIEDQFILDGEGDIPEQRFCIYGDIIYIGFSDTLFIKRSGDNKILDRIPVPLPGKRGMLTNIYTDRKEIFLTVFNKEFKTTEIYRFLDGRFEKIREISPFISNFDFDKDGNIFAYSSFDQTIRKFDKNWSPVFRHRIEKADGNWRGRVVIDRYLYFMIIQLSNIQYIMKYEVG
jgi:hypothetical protein